MITEPQSWWLLGPWILLAFVGMRNVARFRRLLRRENRERTSVPPERQRKVCVIIPIKGAGAHTEAFFDAVLHQDYRSYRVIYTFESGNDPAAVMLREHLGISASDTVFVPQQPGPSQVLLVDAGRAENSGQKIHNQLAAFERLRDDDEIIVLADADLMAGADWLARLVAPINLGEDETCGAYRWLVPEQATAPNLFASVINASVATLGGLRGLHILWGGSMAFTRELCDKVDVPALFAGSLNDDLHFGRAARRTGCRLGCVFSLMMPSPVNFTWASCIEFIRRQYYQLFHYMPKMYAVSIGTIALPLLGWIPALIFAFQGYFSAWMAIATVVVLDQIRAVLRWSVITTLFGGSDHVRPLGPTRLVEHLATPLYLALHLVLALSAMTMRQVTWAGITYRVHDRQDVDLLGRED